MIKPQAAKICWRLEVLSSQIVHLPASLFESDGSEKTNWQAAYFFYLCDSKRWLTPWFVIDK